MKTKIELPDELIRELKKCKKQFLSTISVANELDCNCLDKFLMHSFICDEMLKEVICMIRTCANALSFKGKSQQTTNRIVEELIKKGIFNGDRLYETQEYSSERIDNCQPCNDGSNKDE